MALGRDPGPLEKQNTKKNWDGKTWEGKSWKGTIVYVGPCLNTASQYVMKAKNGFPSKKNEEIMATHHQGLGNPQSI